MSGAVTAYFYGAALLWFLFPIICVADHGHVRLETLKGLVAKTRECLKHSVFGGIQEKILINCRGIEYDSFNALAVVF